MRTNLEQRADVQRFELGIHRQPVIVEDHPLQAHRLAVEQHQFDLGVRHPERLDHVLDRRPLRALAGEGLPPPFGRQKIVELIKEAESCTGHVEQYGRAAGGASLIRL
ncbi:hypothetical protein D3C78_980380 [compost metagenome]